MNEADDIADEASYDCPSCGEEIVVPLDPSEGFDQQYVEDCPVCCSPNVLRVTFAPDGYVRIEAQSE